MDYICIFLLLIVLFGLLCCLLYFPLSFFTCTERLSEILFRIFVFIFLFLILLMFCFIIGLLIYVIGFCIYSLFTGNVENIF